MEFYNITFHTYKHCSCLLFENYEWFESQACRGDPSGCLDAPREGTSPTQQEEIPWVTTPIDVGGLVDSLFRVSIGNPQRRTSEGPIPNVSHKANELDVGLWWHLYCLQLDVMMVQDPSRPPPLWHLWTVATIKDMVMRDAPNIKDCIILSPGLAVLFFSCHQEPQEGLYLHEAQELAEEMTKTITWMGQPTHQQVFPITIAEGWWAISMFHMISKHWDCQFPMETIWSTDGEAQPPSSWTDEDNNEGTHALSPSVMFIGRRRFSWGWHRVWMPLPHVPNGASHGFMGRGYNYWPAFQLWREADRVCFHEGANWWDIWLWWGSSCAHSPQFCWVCAPCPHHIGDTHHGLSNCYP